jgi:hypothetical protein
VRVGKRSLGIIPTLSSNPTPQELGSARSFLRADPHARIVVATPDGERKILSQNLYLMPAGELLL